MGSRFEMRVIRTHDAKNTPETTERDENENAATDPPT
jgi:hypothetical protein